MKKIILLAITVIAGFSNNVQAQSTNTDTATAAAFATIVAPIAITKTTDLQFGTVISGAGTVVVATNDTRTIAVSALNPGDQGAAPTAAVFTLTGEASYGYSIVIDANVPLLNTGGSDTMSMGSFIADNNSGAGVSTGALSSSGADTIKVGATLTVTAGLTAGTYAGSFNVTVAYN
jgi:hypothetical protein